MNEVRKDHGCAATIFGTSKVALVVGGNNRNGFLDTMEMYDSNEWTLHSTRLPLPRFYLQIVNSYSLNYLVYAIGGYGRPGDVQGEIYGLNKTEKWELVGNMKQKRYMHASLNIKSNDFPICK